MSKSNLLLYNSLTRKEEEFKPIKEKKAGMYSCGPTVYNVAHIGNLRTYIFNDLLKRSLTYLGYKVNHVMNITDVDDKTIKGSLKEGLKLKDFTRKYEKIFFEDLDSLNIIKPSHILRATESVPEMISLIEKLLKKEIAYKTDDGIYFSIKKSKNYGKLANLDKITDTKSRIKNDEYDKSSPQDFALWKFYSQEDGDTFWEAPFGKGRPGWHIECSAMSMKVLGSTLDIHTGGIDLLFPHHTNEIAQSEAVTGKKFVNYWIHGGFLTMKEGKMSKSLGNVYTLKDLDNLGYEPLDFRYFTLLTHYRKPLDFNFENLDGAKKALIRLRNKVLELKKEQHKGKDLTEEYEDQFIQAINNDLNLPLAVQILWKVVEDITFDTKNRLKLIYKFDDILGLGIKDFKKEKIKIPQEIEQLALEREKLRKEKKWAEADIIRDRIQERGFKVQDTQEGYNLEKI